jgi:Ca-activated chloride channel family protein
MKAARLALLAAAQLCCTALSSEAAHAANAASAWSNLWRTPDQQAQALLDAGQPAQAAERFQDPRRRAYADLEAGRYAAAAKLLAPFSDTDSEYNRGNALARSGQLQAALAAYDAALKQAPADKDIRHNRDLVERALQQQHQSRQSSRNGRQGGQGTGQQPQGSAGQQGGSGSQQSGSSAQQSGDRGSQSGAGARGASNGPQAGANQPGNSGRQRSAQGNESQGSSTPQAADANGSGSSKEAPGQAQSDAALAAKLAREQRQRGGPGNAAQGEDSQRNGASQLAPERTKKTPDSGNLLAGGTQTPKQKPETERQLALDQWLRQIPDSPAGLLQRKFLIEHMMRQQGNDDPQQGNGSQGSGP